VEAGARAGAEPDEIVHQLCRALDNLPLALELAAARTSVLSPARILERLSARLDLFKGGRDAEARQRTLRATIAWSYELLIPQEKRLFARLAVFRGGCVLAAAEAVAEADLDTLQSLVDKSLLHHRNDRFSMLETIREYAIERLEEGEEEKAIRDRHFDHFLAFAERAYEERITSASTWLPIVDAERDNLRAALDWARISRPEAELQLAGAVAFYWQLRGHVPEATHERLAGALARTGSRDRIRARALTHLGQIQRAIGREASSYLDEALSLWREQGDVLGEALALEAIGYNQLASGEHRSARLALEQSLALRRQAGAPPQLEARSLAGLCQLFVSSGEIERAEPLAQQLQEVATRYEDRDTQGDALHYLADCALIGGDYSEAEDRYLRALAHARRSGSLRSAPWSCSELPCRRPGEAMTLARSGWRRRHTHNARLWVRGAGSRSGAGCRRGSSVVPAPTWSPTKSRRPSVQGGNGPSMPCWMRCSGAERRPRHSSVGSSERDRELLTSLRPRACRASSRGQRHRGGRSGT